MAYNEKSGLVDPFGGKDDLRRGLIRAVGDPALRFSEDALRIMRAFRFSAQLGFDIEESTLRGAVEMAEGLCEIARERIGSEFIKLLTSPHPRHSLALMRENGIFEYIFEGFIPSSEALDRIELLPSVDTVRLALTLWGADKSLAAEALSSLRCSGKQIKGALAILGGANQCVKTPLDARALIASTGIYASYAARLSEVMEVSPTGAALLVEREQNTPCKLSDLKINGKDLAEMGARGKLIGNTLEKILRTVIASPELNERDALLELASSILKNKGE
jgi:tRNA nucleotidyltransferase (CCA-adding enzyme)